MAGAKTITPPYSAHQIYGEFPEKIWHTLFCKSIDCGKQDSEIFTKIWGEITREKRHVHAPHPGKMHEHKFLFLPCTRKRNGCEVCSKFMHSASTGYGLHFEAWRIRHSGDVYIRKQVKEGELTASQWIFQTTIQKDKASSGSRGSSPDLSLKLRFNYFRTYQFPPRKSTWNRQTSLNPNVEKSLKP